MSREGISRRQFLTLPLALLVMRAGAVAAEIQPRRGAYTAEVGILYDALTFRLAGTIEEAIDRGTGRYDVRLVGDGSGIANRVESSGQWIDGRWAPVRTVSWFQVRGRESRSEVTYDYTRRMIDYRFRGETFFLRRLRVVDDTIAIPQAFHVDDVISALFNYAEAAWRPGADGTYHTHVVRRRKNDSEGTDDVEPNARAELVPLALRIAPDDATGKPTALFDMTRFSSWARQGRPARIVFGTNRRPETITSSLILGTSVTIRLRET